MAALIKPLLVAVILLAIGGGIYFFKVHPLESKIDKLENQMAAMSPASSSSDESTDSAVPNIQVMIDEAVQNAVKGSPTKTVTVQTPSNQQSSETFISLGSTATSVSTTYQNVPTMQVQIDSSQFPNATVTWDANLSLNNSNGQAYAQLITNNNGTQTIVPGSEISTGYGQLTRIYSQPFQLLPGSNTYMVQLKSLTGYTVTIDTPRIKIVSN